LWGWGLGGGGGGGCFWGGGGCWWLFFWLFFIFFLLGGGLCFGCFCFWFVSGGVLLSPRLPVCAFLPPTVRSYVLVGRPSNIWDIGPSCRAYLSALRPVIDPTSRDSRFHTFYGPALPRPMYCCHSLTACRPIPPPLASVPRTGEPADLCPQVPLSDQRVEGRHVCQSVAVGLPPSANSCAQWYPENQ